MAALPIPIALIGLSASAATSWAANAHLPALLSPRGKQLFRIAALLNSSEANARAAISHYKLDPAVKAYGDPAALAADPDVRAVICNTRVDNHHITTLPSVQAGKDAYIEWPIASNLADAQALLAAAKKSGARVAIGLQGRHAPPHAAVDRILKDGSLGKVLSADYRAFGGVVDRASLPDKLAYFTEKRVGGNPMTIGLAHGVDAFLAAVGSLEAITTYSQIQRPEVAIVEGPDRKVVRRVTSDVPDLLKVVGRIAPSERVSQNATTSVSFRTGQPFPGDAALLWSVNCERGEVRLEARGGASLQASGYDPAPVVRVHDHASGETKEISWAWSPEQEALPVPARCVYAALEAWAVDDQTGYVGIEEAVERARLIYSWIE